MIEEFIMHNELTYALIIWILVNQFRDHGCLKRLEGLLKGHLGTKT